MLRFLLGASLPPYPSSAGRGRTASTTALQVFSALYAVAREGRGVSASPKSVRHSRTVSVRRAVWTIPSGEIALLGLSNDALKGAEVPRACFRRLVERFSVAFWVAPIPGSRFGWHLFGQHLFRGHLFGRHRRWRSTGGGADAGQGRHFRRDAPHDRRSLR